MAATPKNATFTFQGASGKNYNVDAYCSDVANALVRFDGGAGAGSATPEYWRAPENVLLKDISIVTGMQDTTKLQILRNNAATGDIARYVPHVSTAPFRPAMNVGYAMGTEVRALQLA